MKATLTAALLLLAAAANAQTTPPRNLFDPVTGNLFNVQPQPDGSTRVRGSNAQTGAVWSNTIEPDGDQHGIDSQGNYFTYDEQSGVTINSNGTTCVGKGAARTCY